jgi:pimeloyl-ACP methyl ester carboxylesterase
VATIVALDRLLPAPMARVALGLQRRVGRLRSRSTTIPGFEISYLEGGSGEPLVLVHGIGADKDNFAQIAPFLRGIGRIIAIDLPGFGDSGKPMDADYSIETQADRLAQFLDALGLPRAHLGGSSMGGAIVLAFAFRHPERAQSLWLLAPAGVGGAAESEMFRRYRERGEFPLFAETPEQFAGVMQICFTKVPFVPYSVRRELALTATRNYPLHTRIFRDLLGGPVAIEEIVAGLATPALIVWGDRDRVLDVSGAEILHGALPRSRLTIMPGIGHLPAIEAPRRTAADYRAFRASLVAGAALAPTDEGARRAAG